MLTDTEAGGRKPAISRNSEVLPTPLAPSTTSTSPAVTMKSRSANTRRSPRVQVSFSAVRERIIAIELARNAGVLRQAQSYRREGFWPLARSDARSVRRHGSTRDPAGGKKTRAGQYIC